MNPIITERLTIREFEVTDAPFIIDLLNSQGWLKFIGDRGIRTIEDAQNYLLNGPMESYKKNGFGLFLVELNDPKMPIGMAGLIKRDTLEDIDIGFAFLPEYEGKGYGYESTSSIMDYAKNQLKLKRVLAITMEINDHSIKLLEKLGLSFDKKIRLSEDAEELMLYSSNFQ